ncbi:hypothetical protein [Spongiactinospora sp. 9N601]|uniref:hypothetical protein n=1 Tax=Spongiactinospora sp. 9N601 TaxID=3375149 RepID=UPI003790B079
MRRSNRSAYVRLGAVLVLIVLAGVVTVGAIATPAPPKRPPTAAEAGTTLREHILKLLDKVSSEPARITDPGGRDIPCGDGNVMRTFAATAADNSGERSPHTLNAMMLGTLSGFADYDMTDPGGLEYNLASESYRTSLYLKSSEHGYAVSGQTDCLSRS